MTRALMIQGTGSNVGRSILVARLCRVAQARGLRVAPFKPQNISNTAAVTADGGEIGRAQPLQALNAGRDPVTDMNEDLIKPETGRTAQIIVQGLPAAAGLPPIWGPTGRSRWARCWRAFSRWPKAPT